MKLQEVFSHYKNKNKSGIVPFTGSIPNIPIQHIIEEPLKGNLHLSMVISNAMHSSEKEFLLAALKALSYDNYDISDNLGNYTLIEYNYAKTVEELSFLKTKSLLEEHKVTTENCSVIYKLKEKDELTFLIKTKTKYIFISEIFWLS